MISSRNIFILVFSFIFISYGRGQADTLTTSRAIARALENNYGIIISRADLDIAAISNSWGAAGRYPTVGFEMNAGNNYNFNNQNLTNRIATSIGMDWLIFDGFRVNITKLKLENLEAASEGALAVIVESTIEDIILGYYSVLLDRERLGVLETVMNLSHDRYDYELAKQRLGGSITYNVLQAQNVYLNDKTNFMNQEVILRNNVRNLNFLMGEDPSVTWHFVEDFTADTSRYMFEDLLSKMRSNNQVLKNQYTNLTLQQTETEINRSGYYPSLSLSAGLENTYTNTYNSSTGNSGSNVFAPYGNIRLTYDIFTAGSRKRAMEISRINEDVARIEIERMEHILTNELYNLFDYYEVRIALLELAYEGMAAAELNMSIAQDKYRSGAITSFEFRDIQLIYLNAALQKLQAIYNLIESRTILTRITGGFLSYTGQD